MPAGDRLWQLVEAGISLASESSLEHLLPKIPSAAAALTDARYAALGVLDEHRRELAQWITHGLDEATRSGLAEPPRGRGVLGELIRDPRPLRLADLHYDLRSVGFPPGHPPMTSFLGVPILVGDVPYGNLYLTEKRGGGEFTQEDEDLAVAVSALAATAIGRAGSYDSAHRRLRQLEGLNEVALLLAYRRDTEPVLAATGLRLDELADAELVTITLPDGSDGLRVLPVHAAASPMAEPGDRPPDGAVYERVQASRQPERIGNGLAVPLLMHGEPRGMLAVHRPAGSPPLTDDGRQLIESFAALVAVALELAGDPPGA